MKRVIKAIADRDEDEIKLENNLEGEINADQEASKVVSTDTIQVDQRQALLYMFESKMKAIIDRKIAEQGKPLCPEILMYLSNTI